MKRINVSVAKAKLELETVRYNNMADQIKRLTEKLNEVTERFNKKALVIEELDSAIQNSKEGLVETLVEAA